MQSGVTVQEWASHVNGMLGGIVNTQTNHSNALWLLVILNFIIVIFLIVAYQKLSDLISKMEVEEAGFEQVKQSSPTMRCSSDTVVEPVPLTIGIANDHGVATANPSARKIGG